MILSRIFFFFKWGLCHQRPSIFIQLPQTKPFIWKQLLWYSHRSAAVMTPPVTRGQHCTLYSVCTRKRPDTSKAVGTLSSSAFCSQKNIPFKKERNIMMLYFSFLRVHQASSSLTCPWRLHRPNFWKHWNYTSMVMKQMCVTSGLIMSGCYCSKSLVTVTTCTQRVTFF